MGPDLPDWLEPPRPLAIPTEASETVPAFRFAFPGGRLDIWPWGCGAPANVDRLREPWSGAIGDVLADDDEHAVVRFARGSPAERSDACDALRRWARRDWWRLEIAEGTHPLLVPTPAPTLIDPARCARCGAAGGGRGWAHGMVVQNRGYESSVCRLCGGRVYWFAR